MDDRAPSISDSKSRDARLSAALSRGDSDLAKIVPVLGHLLGNDDHALFSDEVVARVRGMLGSLAQQLIQAEAQASGKGEGADLASRRMPGLIQRLTNSPSLLSHCHGLALEWQLALRMESEGALDPVLSPLLQALIASEERSTSNLGMTALASQARFAQAQRRMELSLFELPAELFHETLGIWRDNIGSTGGPGIDIADRELRESYDEAGSRLGLLEKLVIAMGKGVTAALSIEHAGVAVFLSALAAASGQQRETVIVATNERQATRLMLTLRATGLKPQAVDQQLVYLHSASALPLESGAIEPDRAAALLDESRAGRRV